MKPSNRQAYARLMVLRGVVIHSLATPPKASLEKMLTGSTEDERRKFDAGLRGMAEELISRMRKFGVWRYVSPKEKAFLQSSGLQMDEYAHLAAGWRMECAGMIMWALGLIEEWPKIDEEISSDLLNEVPAQKVTLLSSHPALRPEQEIEAKRDLIELWHWRQRTRRLIEEGRRLEPREAFEKDGIRSYDDIVRQCARHAHERGDLPEIVDDDFVFLGKPFRALSQDEYQLATSIIMERHYALNWLCGMAPRNRWDETPTDT